MIWFKLREWKNVEERIKIKISRNRNDTPIKEVIEYDFFLKKEKENSL